MTEERMRRARQVIPAIVMLQQQSYALASWTVTSRLSKIDVFLVKQRRDFVPRVEHYYEQTIPLYTLDDFKGHFRLSRASFQTLLLEMENAPTFNPAKGPTVNTEKGLLMFLWYIGNLECFRSMADRFGVSKGSFHASVKRTSSALVKDVMAQFIRWPMGAAKLREASTGFSRLSELQDVIGAIDGTHIHIKAPVNHAPAYYNRKKFHSLVLLATCDANLYFTYAWTGNPRQHS